MIIVTSQSEMLQRVGGFMPPRRLRRTFFRLSRVAGKLAPGARWSDTVVLFKLHPSGLNHRQRREAAGARKRQLREAKLRPKVRPREAGPSPLEFAAVLVLFAVFVYLGSLL